MKIKEKSLLKQSLIDEFEIFHFCKNIIEPSYYYQIKEDKIIITIELPGEVLDFKSRINHIRGFYYFKFKGTIKFPESEDLCFKEENMKDGEFRLVFKIPKSQFIISNSPPVIEFNESNGIVIVTYEISEFDRDYDSDSDYEI